MKPLACPSCFQLLEERFMKSGGQRPPVTVLQCARCYCVLLDARAQQELGVAQSIGAAKTLEPGGRECPRCEREFNLLDVPDKGTLFGSVELDRCPACRALFFDPGELQKALGRVAAIAATPDDEYLKSDPERVSSRMSDPRGPWRGDPDALPEGSWLRVLADIDPD